MGRRSSLIVDENVHKLFIIIDALILRAKVVAVLTPGDKTSKGNFRIEMFRICGALHATKRHFYFRHT